MIRMVIYMKKTQKHEKSDSTLEKNNDQYMRYGNQEKSDSKKKYYHR